MPSNSRPRSAEPIARDVRQLPTRPSLEYERKHAKALLTQIRAGDPGAVRRLYLFHPAALRHDKAAELKLADAQHVIAREYGFSSWPRLVEYFEELHRHRNAPQTGVPGGGTEGFERSAKFLTRQHATGDPVVARMLSHFVPRYFRRSTAEILATPLTDDDGRLLVARGHRYATWEEAVERVSADDEWMKLSAEERESPSQLRVREAIRNSDVDAVAATLDEHPELIDRPVGDRAGRLNLAAVALFCEQTEKTEAARKVTELLAERGVDVQRELNEMLLLAPIRVGSLKPDDWRWLLDRGADPNWLPPSGITVLEHAIAKCHSGECVDVIAERVPPPRRALWIAAGLGNVGGVRSFIAAKGRLTQEGRQNRPDRMAMGERGGMPPNLEAGDSEIMWEAFRIAAYNGRWATMDVLLDAGAPIDFAPMGVPLIEDAVHRRMVPLVEYLVRRGADVPRRWGNQ